MDTHNDVQNVTARTDETTDDLQVDGIARPERGVDLTKFQLNILAVLAEEERYGLAVKKGLRDYYDEEVNHGRLYPNLNELIETGYVTKRAKDRRTNIYSITDRGRGALLGVMEWRLGNYLRGQGIDVSDGEALRAVITE